jgi:hypothetical protein
MNKDPSRNPAKFARQQIGIRLSRLYLPNAKIDAIALSGSTVRGGVDDWSDLELAFFWSKEPTLEERARPIREANGSVTRQITPKSQRFYGVENFNLGSLAVDVVHNLTSEFENLLISTIGENNIDPKMQEIVAVSSSFYALFGEGHIERIKRRAIDYPDEYRLEALKNLKFANLPVLKMHASRSDLIPFQRSILNGISEVLKALCAVNGRFFPGDKRTLWLIDSFVIKPADLYSRVHSILRQEPLKAIDEIEELTNKTIELICENLNCDSSLVDNSWKQSRRSRLDPVEVESMLR